jgi:hypothetical protein
MICRKCETQYPDMCSDCLEVISMDFSGVVPDDVKAFEDFSVVYKPRLACGRLNIASAEDLPLLLEI